MHYIDNLIFWKSSRLTTYFLKGHLHGRPKMLGAAFCVNKMSCDKRTFEGLIRYKTWIAQDHNTVRQSIDWKLNYFW